MKVFTDALMMDAKPRLTADGYLVAMPRAARIGIQEYRGSEVGRPEMQVVRVYRPAEEVFHKDSLASFAHKPITVEHPPVLVDAGNWKKYAAGQIGDEIARDGDFIRVPMMVADKAAIDAIDSGKVELSMGYTCDLDFTPGISPTGEQYDAAQRNIRGNHLAIVDAARGGKQLRVIDYQPTKEGKTMTHQVVVDGVSLQVADAATAQLIAKALKDAEDKTVLSDKKMSDLDKKIADMEEELAALKKTKDAESTAKDSIIADLQKKLADSTSPQALADAVASRTALIDSAKKMLTNIVTDGKTDADVRRQVVDSKLGEKAKAMDDAQIQVAFDTLASVAVSVDPLRKAVIDSNGNHQTNDANTAYAEMCKELANAHKQAAKG